MLNSTTTTESAFDDRSGPWIAFTRVFAGLLLLYELTLGGWWKLGWVTTGPNPEWVGADAGAEVYEVSEQAIEEGTFGWFAALLEAVVLPAPELWTVLALAAQVATAVGLILGLWTRPAALLGIVYFLPVFHLGMIRTSPLFTVPIAFAFVANAGRYRGLDAVLWNRSDALGRLTRALNAALPFRRAWYPPLAAAVAVVGAYYLLSIPETVDTRVHLTSLELTVFAGLVAGGLSYVYRGANPTAVAADALRVFVGYRFLQEVVVRSEPGVNALPGWASADAQAEVFEGIAASHVAPVSAVIELAVLPAMSAWILAFAAVQTAVGIALLVGYRTRVAGTVAVGYLAVLTALGLVRLAPLVFASAVVAATLAGRHASLDAVAGRVPRPPVISARASLPAAAVAVAFLSGAAAIGIDPEAGYGEVAGPVALVMLAFGLLSLAFVSRPSATPSPDAAATDSAPGDD
ncbi:DoxX family protein [Natronococcus sp.]|uniref:DoxX family protein n=1 Tax=Natronococcus sp. TaxID=35747 RepID=UPI003A4D5658